MTFATRVRRSLVLSPRAVARLRMRKRIRASPIAPQGPGAGSRNPCKKPSSRANMHVSEIFSAELLQTMHLKEVDANLLVTLDALLVDASVTRAAERLGRSASAISHALAKLREIFADELFVRAGQRLVPTAKALELAPTVHVILAGMESLLRPSKPFDPSRCVARFRHGRERGRRADSGAAAPPTPRRNWRRPCAPAGCRGIARRTSKRSAAAVVISSSTSRRWRAGTRHPRAQAVRRQARHACPPRPPSRAAKTEAGNRSPPADHIAGERASFDRADRPRARRRRLSC